MKTQEIKQITCWITLNTFFLQIYHLYIVKVWNPFQHFYIYPHFSTYPYHLSGCV